MTRRLEICSSATEVAECACAMIAELAPRTVALSGGSTPRATYELLAGRGVLRAADVWVVDERCVPPEARASNAALLRETLGEAVASLHRIRGEDPPDEAARIYGEELWATLGSEPVFDLVVLGMGADGHTASLFPDSPELEERERCAVATRDEHAGFRRVTLTLPVLNRSRSAIFIVTGADKAAAFARIQDGELLPAGRILGATWVMDQAAATSPDPPAPKRSRWDPIEGQESLFEL